MCLTVYIFKKNQFHGMSPKVIESKRVPESIWIGTFANKIFLQKIYILYPVYTLYICVGKLGKRSEYLLCFKQFCIIQSHLLWWKTKDIDFLSTGIRTTLTILTVCGPEWGRLWWPVDWSTITFRWLDWADPKVSKYRWKKICSTKTVGSICHIVS